MCRVIVPAMVQGWSVEWVFVGFSRIKRACVSLATHIKHSSYTCNQFHLFPCPSIAPKHTYTMAFAALTQRSACPTLGAPCTTPRALRSTPARTLRVAVRAQQEPTERPTSVDQINHHAVLAAAMMAPMLFTADPALAINREYGILEGTILSMAHPVVMGALFGITAYTGYLGLKWREVRTIPETVKELKLQLPAANAEGIRPPSEVENKINELEATRKDLIKGKFSDRHEALGALLLGGGVMFSVAGAFNTYIRTGMLLFFMQGWCSSNESVDCTCMYCLDNTPAVFPPMHLCVSHHHHTQASCSLAPTCGQEL